MNGPMSKQLLLVTVVLFSDTENIFTYMKNMTHFIECVALPTKTPNDQTGHDLKFCGEFPVFCS